MGWAEITLLVMFSPLLIVAGIVSALIIFEFLGFCITLIVDIISMIKKQIDKHSKKELKQNERQEENI